MPECHTVDLDRFGVNILSDAERGTITLQMDAGWDGADRAGKLAEQARLLRALGRRFGGGVRSRLLRWMRGERDVLRIDSRSGSHLVNPEVIRVEMIVSRGERMDVALGVLLDFFRRQPGYRRTFGAPLDLDSIDTRARQGTGDDSEVAMGVLRRILELRNKQIYRGES